MMTPHDPIRTCIGCRRKDSKSSLVRFVLARDREIRLDARQILPGRGAYLCRNMACFEKAWKRKAFVRALKIPPAMRERMDGQMLERLKKEMETFVLQDGGRPEEGDLNEQT